MPKLPKPTGGEMVRFLESQGYSVARIRGSHHFMVRKELHTTIPVHKAKTLKIGTLRAILRDIDMSTYDFSQLWASKLH